MILVVFSIGQFIGSDLGVLKQGFQEWFHNNGRSTSGEMVWEWIAKNLKPLRVKGSRYLEIDFVRPWTKSTRQRAKLKGRDRPASGTLR